MTKASDLAINPDEWAPGLAFALKTLSARSVRRAKEFNRVVLVALQHNLRRGNAGHRHRSPIDAERSRLNAIVIGPDCPEIGSALAGSTMDALGIRPDRWDAVAAIELVLQPPEGFDTPEFWAECIAWVRGRYEHVLSAAVHRDQKRPHLHAVVLAVAGGRLAGSAMTTDANQPNGQRIDFCRHMFERFGIRPNRHAERKAGKKPKQPKTLAQLATSTGKGPKTSAAAARRDAALVRSAGDDWKQGDVCMGFDVHGVRPAESDQTPCTAEKANPILRSLPTAEVARTLCPEIGEKQSSETAPTAPPPDHPSDASKSAGAGSLTAPPGDTLTATKPTSTSPPPAPPTSHCPRPPAPASPPDADDSPGFSRERDSDRSAGQWCAELGEFVSVPTRPKAARAEAESWVRAALADRAKGSQNARRASR